MPVIHVHLHRTHDRRRKAKDGILRTIACPVCHGNGNLPSGQTCPRCKGTGEIKVDIGGRQDSKGKDAFLPTLLGKRWKALVIGSDGREHSYLLDGAKYGGTEQAVRRKLQQEDPDSDIVRIEEA